MGGGDGKIFHPHLPSWTKSAKELWRASIFCFLLINFTGYRVDQLSWQWPLLLLLRAHWFTQPSTVSTWFAPLCAQSSNKTPLLLLDKMAEPATTTCKNYPWRNSQPWQLQFYSSSIAFLGELATIFLKQTQLFSFLCSSAKGLGLTKSRTTPTTDCGSQAWLSPFDGFDYRINGWSNHLDLRLDYHPLLGFALASLHALANHKQQWQISMQGNTRTIEEEDQDSSRPYLFFIF